MQSPSSDPYVRDALMFHRGGDQLCCVAVDLPARLQLVAAGASMDFNPTGLEAPNHQREKRKMKSISASI